MDEKIKLIGYCDKCKKDKETILKEQYNLRLKEKKYIKLECPSCNKKIPFYHNLDKTIKYQKRRFKRLKFDDLDNLRSRFNNYTTNATDRTDAYAAQRKIFLEINLTLMIFLGAFLSVIVRLLPDDWLPKILNHNCLLIFMILIIAGIIFLVISIYNIIYSLIEHRTFPKSLDYDDFWKTRWFYRGHIHKKKKSNQNEKSIEKNILNAKKEELYYLIKLNKFAKKFHSIKKTKTTPKNEEKTTNTEEKLIRDDLKNLFKLYQYQSNYFSIAKHTRITTLIAIGVFILMIIIIIHFTFVYFYHSLFLL